MGYLKRIIYNCKKATFLIDKMEGDRITLREHIELRIHLIGCSFCRLYKKQSRSISEMVRQLFRSAVSGNQSLSEEFKRDLQRRIDNELNNS